MYRSNTKRDWSIGDLASPQPEPCPLAKKGTAFWSGPSEDNGHVPPQASQARVAELETAWKTEAEELRQVLAETAANLNHIRAEQASALDQVG